MDADTLHTNGRNVCLGGSVFPPKIAVGKKGTPPLNEPPVNAPLVNEQGSHELIMWVT